MADTVTSIGEAQRLTDIKLADILKSLAEGNTVSLGDFGDNGSDHETEADTLASQLYEIELALREGRLKV